jgi:hypothetical protein
VHFWTKKNFTKYSNLMHSDPPSQDGLRGLTYFSDEPWYTGRKLIRNPQVVITESAYKKFKYGIQPQPIHPQPYNQNNCGKYVSMNDKQAWFSRQVKASKDKRLYNQGTKLYP